MGYHERMALRRRLEIPTSSPLPTNKRFAFSEPLQELFFESEQEFWDEGFDAYLECDDYDFKCEIRKVL